MRFWWIFLATWICSSLQVPYQQSKNTTLLSKTPHSPLFYKSFFCMFVIISWKSWELSAKIFSSSICYRFLESFANPHLSTGKQFTTYLLTSNTSTESWIKRYTKKKPKDSLLKLKKIYLSKKPKNSFHLELKKLRR